MTVTTRPLTTAFDPPGGPAGIATPTCCCCCCCCLASTTAYAAFTVAEAYYQADERPDRRLSAGVAAWLGLAAVVVPIGLTVALSDSALPAALALAAIAVAPAAVYVAAGRSIGAAVLTALAAIGLGAAAFVVEFFLALATAFVIELVTPFAIWGGLAVARARHRRRTGWSRPPDRRAGAWPPPTEPP